MERVRLHYGLAHQQYGGKAVLYDKWSMTVIVVAFKASAKQTVQSMLNWNQQSATQLKTQTDGGGQLMSMEARSSAGVRGVIQAFKQRHRASWAMMRFAAQPQLRRLCLLFAHCPVLP